MDNAVTWKDIPHYEGLYQINSEGQILSLRRNRLMKQTINQGYYRVCLRNKYGKQVPELVHRLVALTFIPNPTNLPCVNHKDENKLNNSIDNLEWCTREYNTSYSMKGRPKTEEQKRKMSEKAFLRTGTKNGFYGKTHSDISKQKMSAAKASNKISEETKKKISEGVKRYYARKN